MKNHSHRTVKHYFFISVLISLVFPHITLFAKESDPKIPHNIMENQKNIIIKITKNTSLEELENIKQEMAAAGFEFDYSNVFYNGQKEIIAISITYKDSSKNQGNYSVSSQNPIADILITSNGKKISINTQGGGNQASINQGNANSTLAENENNFKEGKAEMERRRMEMDRKMTAHIQEMKERQEKMRTLHERRRDSIFNNYDVKIKSEFTGDYKEITKHSTTADLNKIREAYKAEGIQFSFSQLKRNQKDEITHIAIKINNGKGSSSISTFGDGNGSIKDIVIGVDQEHTIIKNKE